MKPKALMAMWRQAVTVWLAGLKVKSAGLFSTVLAAVARPLKWFDSRLNRDEREFLPAALEIVETPPRPLGYAVGYLVCGLFGIAVIWAMVSDIDVTATAQGSLVPVGGVKVIKPLQSGIVREIRVHNGQHVEKHDLLILLDSTETEVDTQQMQRQLRKAEMDIRRLTTFIEYVDRRTEKGGGEVSFPLNSFLSQEASLQLRANIIAFDSQLHALDAELTHRRYEIARIESNISKLEQTLPLLAEREETLSDLMKKGITPKPVWLEIKQQYIEAVGNLDVERSSREQAQASLDAGKSGRQKMIAERREALVAELRERQDQFEEATLYLRKARKRDYDNKLRAPVAGTVQQLSVQTVGGVVSSAETLLVIVPDDVKLEAEVKVLNKDVGFVRDGQEAVVKIDSFPFTKYGHIDGEVVRISKNAVEDENFGLIYNSRVRLNKASILAEHGEVPLMPGMTVTVDFSTGKRKLIEFLLSPILRYKKEALRER